MQQTIQFGKRSIPYILHESGSRKTLGIAVEDGQVIVTIPAGTNTRKYEQILLQKAPWILKQLAHFEEMRVTSRSLQFRSGEKLPYLGRYYRLKVRSEAVSVPTFRFFKGQFEAVVPLEASTEDYRNHLYPLYKEWIIQKGKRFAEKRINRFTQRLGKTPSDLSVRSMEKRWGSCTPQGRILLNWRIFLAPVSMVDYVLAHELAHLKEMNHTQAYWDTLRMLLPDYEERKEWLRLNGSQLYV
ncbi:M48 family metallopeptidase [Domibacillus indicus]|uniref:M48 family metallopeptidase n=1 Tax=Domibacillus indicus TaxID=1437523 RepID=UPI000617E99C|nr:SprT family zinc-dependent metalloprotease [Domibacillus indicus]